MGTRCADHVTPLYPQKLALTSPTGGGHSVSIVRSWTKTKEFSFFNQCFMGIDSWASDLVVSRFSMALSTNPATLYHPKRPEFSTTVLWKPRYTVKGGGSSVVILSGSWKYEYFTVKCLFSVTIYLSHFVSVYKGNFFFVDFRKQRKGGTI